ncbi:F-box domain-containing protein [Mycena sanguinolenta]|uniref:F-box domain-containing protein n=1 Tax=Mycena sanguinolenta TaxID=230812 RepID=A0A8H6X6D2_9AGAR|nr:F-box domain-containing protein [Mycena sanguinolenta]
MKVSVTLLALACAASATPLRVIVVSNNRETLQPIPAPRPIGSDGKLEPAVAHLNVIKPQVPTSPGHSGPVAHVWCGTGARQRFRFREKATALADELRIAFGFKPSSHWHGYQHPPKFEELKMHQPLPFIGGPDRMFFHFAGPSPGIGGKGGAGITPGKDSESKAPVGLPPLPFMPVPPYLLPPPPISLFDLEHQHHRVHPHPEHFDRMHHGHWRHGSPPFLTRVHFALMSLGPWEGRAVAFVLGVEQYIILEGEDDEDAEEIFVAPPMYTYPVEKVALSVEVEVEVPAIVVSEAEETK